MNKERMKRDLAYYKGRLIDFEHLILTEKDTEWIKTYLVSYSKCYIIIRTIETNLGIVHNLPGKAYPIER